MPQGSFDLPIREHVDIYQDAGRALGIEQIAGNVDFRLAREGDLKLDFSEGRYWLRFALANDGKKERHAVLRISPPHFHTVRLFYHSGTEIEAANKEGLLRNPQLFTLNLPPNSQHLYYLQLDGHGSIAAGFKLTDLRPFLLAYRYELFNNGVGIGLLLALAAANLAMFAVYPRVRLFLLMALYAICNMGTIAAAWGYLALSARTTSLFENPAFISLTHVSMVLAIFIANAFQASTIEGPNRWKPLITLLIGLNGIAAITATQLPVALSTQAMLMLVGFSALVITLRPLATYLITQDRVAFHYLFARAWIILFLTFVSLLYLHFSATIETINMLLLLGTAVEVLILSAMAAVHRQQQLRKSFENQLRIATLEAEVRGGNESLRRFNQGLITPLSTIFGTIDMMRHSPLSPQQRDYVNNFQAASQEMLGVVENLQSQDLLDAEQPAPPELLIELPLLLSDVVESHATERVSLSRRLQVPDQVIGDPGRLRQLLSQLFLIAAHYQSKAGIELAADWDGQLKLDIHYQGRKALSLLRAEESNAESQKTRAAVINQLVQALGGQLRLQSLGPDQHLQVFLPLTKWVHEQKLPKLLQLKSRRILIVEANRHFALQQKRQCEQWGMIAFVAQNSRQAIALLRNQCLLRARIHILLVSDSETQPKTLSVRLRQEASSANLPAPATIFMTEHSLENFRDAEPPYRIMSKPSASFTLKRLIVELLEELMQDESQSA